MRRGRCSIIVALALALGGCGAPAATAPTADRLLPSHWTIFRHVPAIVDIAGPRRDGQLTLALAGRLSLLGAGGLVEFARGKNGYATHLGTEPYVALAPDARGRPGGCSFGKDDLYALEPGGAPAIIRVDPSGHATRFATLPNGSFPNGISFDTTGAFERRLLVSAAAHGSTSILAIDCHGSAQTVTGRAPALEGGIAVAPPSFGAFAGELIAPDEKSGRIYAVDARGTTRTVAESRLPHGGDIGVESEGFVPARFTRRSTAYLADRSVPANAHPGTDSILTLTGAALTQAGVRPGDLLVASEGGAETIAVRCRRTCLVRHVAAGPAATHAEGHIAFAAPR